VASQEALGDEQGKGRFQRIRTRSMLAHHIVRRDATLPAVGQIASIDACGRADDFDGGDLA